MRKVFDEQAFIALCKKKIEERFAFGDGNGSTQRDLESLARHIQEKTDVILSLSTLKRVWKGQFKQLPQIATLNALAAVLDYKDWQEFKVQNQPAIKYSKPSFAFPRRVLLAISIFAILAIIILLNIPKTIRVNGPVQFSAEKTVTSGIPNTVVFHYDVKNIEADSFYIQQSWNEFHRVAINPERNAYTSIYYEPGYHRAKLYADDSLVAMQPIHILSDGWQPHIYYSEEDKEPIHFRGDRFIEGGRLQLGKELLKRHNVDLSKSFLTRVSNIQEFKLASDNFSLYSRMKLDSLTDNLCTWMQMTVVTEKHVFWVRLYNKGCERYAAYKTGEIARFGEDNDLSALGLNLYQWQDVGIHVENKHAEIMINGKTVFQEVFKEDFGQIMGLLYIFDGVGSLDEVQLRNEGGKSIFRDDFEK